MSGILIPKNLAFKIYADAPDGNARRMPVAQLLVTTSPRTVGDLLDRLERFTACEEARKQYPWAERFVMGYLNSRAVPPLNNGSVAG